MREERIQLGDTTKDILFKMSEGNPGALTVLLHILKENARIDPNDFFDGLGPILSLDSYGIYGSSIWILYKDVCGEDITKTLAVLRAVQLGFFSAQTLKSVCEPQNYSRIKEIPVQELCDKVKERLPDFII
jgi:hypothetical protein